MEFWPDKGKRMKQLNTDLTSSLVRRITSLALLGDIEKIEAHGVNQDQAQLIAALRPAAALHLAQMPCKNATLELNVPSLASLLEKLKTIHALKQSKSNGLEDITCTLLRRLAILATDPMSRSELQKEHLISNEHLNILSSLGLADIHAIAETGIIFYKLTTKNPEFTMSLNHIIRSERENDMVNELIDAEASQPMFTALTGLKKNVFQQLRRGREVASQSGGHPKQISNEQFIQAWDVWKETPALPLIGRCLAIHKELKDVELRTLWPTIQSWMERESNEPQIKKS